ncbi:MAG: SDR family NAD(P)-dependent oxidoreductase [Zoogloeaceae bacterium]|nr:SDR family NAD(P)-dependent oxidoreductase [Rhodocyclaceae bacterium]MCP5236820.1 SDR family NAD(P)-dependent oxidoreductase [Zoogloeaceae bacterium]
MKTVLVVGASRGLGLEFVRQYAAAGWRVLAGLRHPASTDLPAAITTHAIDVCNLASIDAVAEALQHELDHLVISAGALGVKNLGFETPDPEDFDRVMRTNVLGTIALIEQLAPRMAAGGTIAVLSSRMGSIGDADSPFALLYRCSKAAVNMVVKCAASAYADSGLRIVALYPGWVRTEMGGPDAPLLPPESVTGMRRVIDDADAFPSGGFFSYRGDPLPW